jgi:hypothetical protein
MNRECAVFFIFIFRTLFLSHFIFVILFYLFWFLTAINLLMFVLVRKDCC